MQKRTKLPRAALASMRSKAHRQSSHELSTKQAIMGAARKLLNLDPSQLDGGITSPSGSVSGSGSGFGSGSNFDPEDAGFLAHVSVGGVKVCSGALIAPSIVLTTASCHFKVDAMLSGSGSGSNSSSGDGVRITIAGETAGSGSGSASGSGVGGFAVVHTHVHPSALFDSEYDIAIVVLDGSSSATPVKLYDGGDLGISDCKRMKLSYLSWHETGTSYGPMMTTVQLADHRECMERYHTIGGNIYDELSGMGKGGGVSRSEICVAVPHSSPPTGPCYGDIGLPLTASKIKGRQGSWLLGLSHADHCGDDMPLPAVFTRVSSSLQWILATVPSLAAYPDQFTMTFDVHELGLPDGANITVHHGPYFSEDNIVEDGILDSKCMVPWGTQTSQGAMLIMLHMPTHQPSCDKECVDTMGFTAKFDLAPCDHCVSGCHMSVPWDKMGPEFEDKGKGFTGGLGKRMVKRADKEYGVWACVRDWSPEEQIACGAQHNELACFWFEEKHRTFDFKGLNKETRLVTPAQYEHGVTVEDHMLRGRTLATSPDQAHF